MSSCTGVQPQCHHVSCLSEAQHASLTSIQPSLTTTLAPSLPNTPLSLAFGLLSRPFFLPRKASMPEGLSPRLNCSSVGESADFPVLPSVLSLDVDRVGAVGR